jgi:hypothetical protein
MTRVIRGITFLRAGILAHRKGASIGRAAWSPKACVVARGGELVLVYGGLRYPFTPHSIDTRRADWLAVLPGEAA